MTRHSIDYLSLGFGLFFAASAAVLLLADAVAITWGTVMPAVLIALGAIVITAAWSRRPAAPTDEG